MDKLLERFNINTKKGIENLVILLFLIIIVMIVINNTFKDEEKIIVNNTLQNDNVNKKTDDFEIRLEKILSTISGVGKVNVMVSYENTSEKIPLYDTKEITTITEEVDKNGGERKTKEVNNEYSIAYEESSGVKNALVKQSISPKIIGVIVTAEGAQSSIVKENIISAVMAVTNLSMNKIQVFSR